MKLNKMTILFLVIGLICFGIAAYFQYYGTKKPNNINSVNEKELPYQENTNKEKGNAFEDYVFELLTTDKHIKLLSKASDYYKNGKSAEDNSTPDFKFQYHDTKFAIECKYRSQFIDGKIDWAKSYQITNYNQFEIENNQKVFIAIGVGGAPNVPDKIYFVPLYRLTKEFAAENYINEFKVNHINEIKKILHLE